MIVSLALCVALDAAGKTPPVEFRIFAEGINETTKGSFLFDAAAAEQVLRLAAQYGNEFSIDYAHAQLGATSSVNPSEHGKAAGWFTLELRGGELWAVNVRWTPRAAEALSAGEWRYTSPAFFSLPSRGARRIQRLINVALTNIPATHNLTPLVAAAQATELSMNPDLVKKALDALIAGDAEGCAGILKEMVASAAGAASEDPAPASEEPGVVDAGDPAAEKPEDPAAAMAATAQLMRLTGADTFSGAIEAVEMYRQSHIALEQDRAKLARDRVALEAAERDSLGVKLVTLGGRSPAAVWANPLDAGDAKKRKLRKNLAALSIEDLREEVRLSAPIAPKTPTSSDGGAPLQPPAIGDHGLTELQLEIAKEYNLEPAEYAAQLKHYSLPTA